MYPDGRNPRLSPAYDIISTVLYPKLEDCLAIDLGRSRKYEDVKESSFHLIAKVIERDLDEVITWVRELGARVRAVWRDEAAQFAYTAAERTLIEKHLKRVPLGA